MNFIKQKIITQEAQETQETQRFASLASLAPLASLASKRVYFPVFSNGQKISYRLL